MTILTPSTMYWITRMDGICIGLAILSAVLIIVGFILFTVLLDLRERGYAKKSLIMPIVGIILLIVNVFLPSTKDMCAIIIIPKIVNNERIQGNVEKLLELSEAWIDENLKAKKNN